MTAEWVELSELMVSKAGSVNPTKFIDEKFELFSIPAFDRGASDLVLGSEIGSNKQIVRPGDLMLSRIVPHIRRAWIVPASSSHRQIASGEWILFRSPRIHGPYLRQLLTSDFFNRQFMQTVAGVGGSLLRARPAHVAKIKVPLPPLDEQRRIAAILDKADELRTKRREALAHLDTLTPSLFQASFGLPSSNAEKWPTVALESVARQITDGEHQTPIRQSSGIKLLSARNVRNGRLDVGNVDYIDMSEYERISRRCRPQRDDVLISCSGSIGRVAVVNTDENFSLVRSVALVRPRPEKLLSKFLEQQLLTPKLQRKMNQSANTSSQANLFQGPIRKLPIVLPPMELQGDFVDKATAVERVKDQHRAQIVALDDLFAALQHRAFRGEL